MPSLTMPDACRLPPPAPLYDGIAEFNRGEYFECHETLENLWMHEPAPIRRLYQGILQVGVGFYHLRNGNYRGTLNLLASAVGYLRDFAPSCMGVDVARLIADAASVRAAILALGPERFREYDLLHLPRILYDPAVAATSVPLPLPEEGGAEGPGHW